MNPAELICAGFSLAQGREPALSKRWVSISFSVGAALRDSLMVVQLQALGQLDLLIRSFEQWALGSGAQNAHVMALQHHQSLARYWICDLYEVMRVLKSRGLLEVGSEFQRIFHDVEALRMPLEKFEIAKDRRLAEPMMMHRLPSVGEATDTYAYDPKDPKRAHIMRQGLSSRGSVMWEATDVDDKASRWIERLAISERVLSLWSPE